MKKMLAVSIVLLLTISNAPRSFAPLSYGQEAVDPATILEKELSVLNLKNPEIDMENNYANGDMRFIGIYNWSVICPGVPEDDDALVRKYGVREIDGTSDVIEGEKHDQLVDAATAYAKSYNKALLKKLNK